MKDSTKRAVRTLTQGVIAAAAVIPIMANALPHTNAPRVSAIVAAVVGAGAVVSKVVNALEEAGRIPAWMKPDVALPGVPDGTVIDATTGEPVEPGAGPAGLPVGGGGVDDTAAPDPAP